MRFLLASAALHVAMVGVLVLPVRGGAKPPVPAHLAEAKVFLVELAKLAAAAPPPPKVEGTVRYPEKKPKPKPTPQPRPTPAPKPKAQAAKPAAPKPAATPKPAPTVDPDKELFDALRKHPYFAGRTDDEIRKMPLPPGMKSWREVLAMTGALDQLDWTQAPPDTGKKQAAGGGGISPEVLAGLMDLLKQESFGGAPRQQSGEHWIYAFRMMDTVLVARWKEGETVATVFYYAYGAKEDPQKSFDVPVDADDAMMAAAMQFGYQEAIAGRPARLKSQ